VKRKIIFLLVGGVIVLSCLVIFLRYKNNENVLARMAGRKITIEEFQNRIADMPSYYRGFLATQDGKMELLNGMIAEAVLVQKAREEGLDRKEEVKRKLQNVEERVLLEAMVQELQKGRIAVSDEEVKEHFKKNEDKFSHPEQVRVSHILVKKKSDARKVLNELREGASFEKLAQKYSIDSITAPRGGDLGYISRGEMIPQFEEVAFGLGRKGDISQIIETPFGYHLVKLTDRKKMGTKTPEEIEYEIRTKIQNEKLDRLMEKYRKELMVSVNPDLLDKVVVGTEPESKGEKENAEEKSDMPATQDNEKK